MQIYHDPRLHDPDPGPQEKSTEKYFTSDCGHKILLPSEIHDMIMRIDLNLSCLLKYDCL